MEMTANNVAVFSTEASLYFAKKIAAGLGINVSNTTRKSFGDVENYYCLGISSWGELTGKSVIFVGSTHTDSDIMELYSVGCTLAEYGTLRRIFVIPFLGYSTMERAKHPGEVVMAKVIARMLSSIPNTGLGNTFLFMDLHVSGEVNYFEGNCQHIELYAEKRLIAGIRELMPENFMFGSVDMGRSRWVQSFAKTFGNKRIALIQKERDGEKTKIIDVIGDVTDKNVVIYDDMTRSAGSLIDGANAYLDKGAKSVDAVLSHFAPNNQDIIGLMLESQIDRFVITNTHPASEWVEGIDRFRVKDVSPIFLRCIQKILGLPPIKVE